MRLPWKRWLLALLAILTGNAIYLLLLSMLPPAVRHAPFALDRGLAADFVLCAALYLLLLQFFRSKT